MAELPQSLRPRRPAAVTSATPVSAWPDRLSWFGSWLLVGLSLLLCVAGVFTFMQYVQHAPAAQIRVVGDLSPMQHDVLQTRLQPLVQSGYFSADLAQVRDGALLLPWVERVVVTRNWPQGILVRTIPRHAVARWGSGRLLSDRGDVFVEVQPTDRRDLPLLHGPTSQTQLIMQQYRQINQWFAPLAIHLRELHLTERMTWFMQFDNGLRVIVDQEQTHTKLQHLSQLAQTGLQPVWPHIAAVDLRYRNGMALQWITGRPPLVRSGRFMTVSDVETARER
jgi:cell division protein FtsQ